MNITIICIGRIKENYVKTGLSEYMKRLSKYCKINIIELEDEKVPDKYSERELEIIQNTEANRIKSVLKSGYYAIALDSGGQQLTSEDLASKINNLGICGQSNLVFIIGGTTGLSKEIRKSSDAILSFSKLTFPHQLIRLFLLEQLFRCFKINMGETYHR